jgi:molybdopterin-guanine dinucleotide biosynthesis protein A
VPDARPRLVVGPTKVAPGLPVDVAVMSEDPPGGGPVAAAAAGLALLPPGIGFVALLAADLPFVTRAAISDLRRAAAAPTLDGALFIDSDGQRQLLCAVWRVASLTSRLGALGVKRDSWSGSRCVTWSAGCGSARSPITAGRAPTAHLPVVRLRYRGRSGWRREVGG